MEFKEILYAVITLLFLVAVVFLTMLLFRTKKNAGSDGPEISDPIGGRNKRDRYQGVSDYALVYGVQESVNGTISGIALEVVVTNILDPRVKERSCIYDDEKLRSSGVIVGRENCDYNIRSLFIDRDGTFKIKKRAGGDFVILAARVSKNGIAADRGGDRVERIEFTDGRATVYVESLRFDFAVPGKTPDEPSAQTSGQGSFYDDVSDDVEADDVSGGDTRRVPDGDTRVRF